MLTRRFVLPTLLLVLVTSVILCPASGSADTEAIVGIASLPTDDLSDTQRAEIEAMLDLNRELLAAQGRLPAPTAPGVILSWPLRFTLGPSDFGYHGISAHVDQDATSPGVLDYNCGNRTYNTHGGTDIMLLPLPWNRVDAGTVEVVAAADGILFGTQDGNPDHNCASAGNWNAAFVRHADGSISWYGHLKNGSVTTKNPGDPIVEGEHLGAVASSGQSNGPHLHFEVHDSLNNKIDPYTGTCNSLNRIPTPGGRRSDPMMTPRSTSS